MAVFNAAVGHSRGYSHGVAMTEYAIQSAFIRYMELMHPDILLTISPAGFIMSAGMARKMVNMGYRKGTPDVLIFEPRATSHGFFIEFKAPGGKTSESQESFLALARQKGYGTAVCFDTASAITIIEEYLKRELF